MQDLHLKQLLITFLIQKTSVFDGSLFLSCDVNHLNGKERLSSREKDNPFGLCVKSVCNEDG